LVKKNPRATCFNLPWYQKWFHSKTVETLFSSVLGLFHCHSEWVRLPQATEEVKWLHSHIVCAAHEHRSLLLPKKIRGWRSHALQQDDFPKILRLPFSFGFPVNINFKLCWIIKRNLVSKHRLKMFLEMFKRTYTCIRIPNKLCGCCPIFCIYLNVVICWWWSTTSRASSHVLHIIYIYDMIRAISHQQADPSGSARIRVINALNIMYPCCRLRDSLNQRYAIWGDP